MEVVSAGPIPAGSVLWQAASGQWVLTVVAKVTFVLLPGMSPLAPEQEAPHPADTYWHGDERCSLSEA